MSKRALDEYHEDIKAFGGSNAFRGIARLALTCFIEPMQKQKETIESYQDLIEEIVDNYGLVKFDCAEKGCIEISLETIDGTEVAKTKHAHFANCVRCGGWFCEKHVGHNHK